MSEHKRNGRDDGVKQITENVNSVYPKMDLKALGNPIRSTSKGRSSHNSSFSNNDAVQEEDIGEEKEIDEMHTSKSKFKHVNILTDSDEFNSQIENMPRPKSATANGDLSGTSNRVDNNQDSILEGCDEEEEGKEQVSKFGATTQLIEESLRLDKGEFDCSTPKQRKQQSIKKLNPSGSYQHCNKAEEAIEEDPKEGDIVPDTLVIPRINSHKEIKIIVDEIETQEKQRMSYMETSVPIQEEPREEEGVEENKQVRAGNKNVNLAKQERDNEKNYIKKIAKGDLLTGAEVLRDLEEELPQGILEMSGSQRISEDVGADGNYEDEDDEEEEEEDVMKCQKRKQDQEFQENQEN